MWSFLVHSNLYKKILFSFFTQYKNEWKKRKFRRQNNKKSDFYKNQNVTKIDYIYVNKIFICKEEPYGTKSSFKYFIGYNYDDAIKLLSIKLPQMIGYVRKSEGNTTMSFKINNSKLLKKDNQILKKSWKIVENRIW